MSTHSDKYVNALLKIIYSKQLCGKWRDQSDAPRKFLLQQELALAVSRNDIPALEQMVAYYENTSTLYQTAIAYGFR